MKMYILELYADERKLRPCDIAGYYTSKAALIRDLKKHSDELGDIWGHGLYTIEGHAEFDFRYFDSDCANIEIVETNQWTA